MTRPPNIIYPSIKLKNVTGTIPVKSNFTFNGFTYTFTLNIPRAIYEGAKESETCVRVPKGTPDSAWIKQYHASFVKDTAQRPVYDALISLFRKIKAEQNLTSDEYIELITVFVQTIPYDTEKYNERKRQNENHPSHRSRFPVETLVENKGLCGEKSYLLAALLSLEGYAVSLLLFQKDRHMAVGIPSAVAFDYSYGGHAFIETTSISYIGAGDGTYGEEKQKLTAKPEIIKIGTGKKYHRNLQLIKYILTAEKELKKATSSNSPLNRKIKQKEKELNTLQQKISTFSKSLDTERLELKRLSGSAYNKKCQEYNARIEAYNDEVRQSKKMTAEYNQLVDTYNQFLRLKRYISENAQNKKAVLNEIKKKKASAEYNRWCVQKR